jgi:hypothetical protein
VGNWTKQNFFKGRNPNGKKIHVKKCSPSLTIKEMKIKTTLRFHLTPDRTATIKNTTNKKYWWGWGNNQPLYTAGGNVSYYTAALFTIARLWK